MPQPADAALFRSLSGLGKADWLHEFRASVSALGSFTPLGPRHFAGFVAKGRTLLVSFEALAGIRSLADNAHPLGWRMVQPHGWSHLCLICEGDTWFRDAAVYHHFDQLADDGFFDAFDRVVFYGAGPCAYAACAFSVAAPGAVVLAIQPQATLDPAISGWDDRFRDQRRLCFTDRYGYAPDMIDAAQRAYILHDPTQPLDAMHAALFTRPNVSQFRLRHMGAGLQGSLLAMGILHPLIHAAAGARLRPLDFARLYRARRDHPPYLRALRNRLEQDGRDALSRALARNLAARLAQP